MARAHREVPAVTWVEECYFGDLDLKLLVPTLLKACAESLKEFPALNARLEGEAIVYLDRYDLGVAVQTDEGLVVPVVRDCDTPSSDVPPIPSKGEEPGAGPGLLASSDLSSVTGRCRARACGRSGRGSPPPGSSACCGCLRRPRRGGSRRRARRARPVQSPDRPARSRPERRCLPRCARSASCTPACRRRRTGRR